MGERDDLKPAEEKAAFTQRKPLFNIPGNLLVFIGLMAAIHLVRLFLLDGQADRELLALTAFLPARYLFPLADQDLGWLWGPVTYSLLHGGTAHLAFNALWLAVFGTPVAKRVGTIRFTALWIVSSIVSAFTFAVMTGFQPALLIGASGVISAVTGAACRFAIMPSGFRLTQDIHTAPRLSIFHALAQRSVIFFIIFWLFSNVLLSAGLISDNSSPVAWQAHLGGFLFGYLFFSLFDRKITEI